MTVPDLAGQVDAAEAIRLEFESALDAALRGGQAPDFEQWARRLAEVARDLAAILNGPVPAITMMFPDGSAFLTAADVLTAVGALWDARSYASPSSPAAAYAALSRALGDDR